MGDACVVCGTHEAVVPTELPAGTVLSLCQRHQPPEVHYRALREAWQDLWSVATRPFRSCAEAFLAGFNKARHQ